MQYYNDFSNSDTDNECVMKAGADRHQQGHSHKENIKLDLYQELY
jgi:hypothetical protein